MNNSYRNIRFMTTTDDTHDDSTDTDSLLALAAEFSPNRRSDPIAPFPTIHLGVASFGAEFLDEDEEFHRFSNLFRARFAVTDDAVELSDEIGVVGNPNPDGRPTIRHINPSAGHAVSAIGGAAR